MASERRLIDANALSEHKFPLTPLRYHAGWNDAIDTVIENAPTVDASEVVHGRFILDREKDVIRCSACGFETPTLIPYVCNGVNWTPLYERKYCGNCGAKMDGERKDNV